MTRRVLVLGARSPVARFLLPRLRQTGWEVHAASRRSPSGDDSGLHWHTFDLFSDPGPDLAAEALISLGPLDGAAAWFARSAMCPARIVAFSSTSAATKQTSIDARERALAQRLRVAEQALLTLGRARGAEVTLLRPTLIYGGGDRNLSRVAELAQRWRVLPLPLPRNATGLRQPVHAEDLAQAALTALTRQALPAASYDLPGGETLSYREMVQRVLACLQPPARVFTVPEWPLRIALNLAHRVGMLQDAGEAMLQRLAQDLVFDASAAQHDLDFRARDFRPSREMFVAAGSTRMLHRTTKKRA